MIIVKKLAWFILDSLKADIMAFRDSITGGFLMSVIRLFYYEKMHNKQRKKLI